MAKAVIQANIQSANGSVIVAPNASIYITDAGSGLPVTLWEERAGTTPTANPTTADTNGFFRVYANPGRVNIEATYGGNVQTFMDVPILEEGTGSPDGIITIDFASDADLTLSSTQAANRFIILTDGGAVLTTARNVIFPADAREWVVFNNTAQTLTTKTAAGTGIAITASNAMRVYGDETNIEKSLVGDAALNNLTANSLTAEDNLKTQRTVINFASDANYTLTAAQNNHSQVEMADTGVILTTAKDVLFDATPRLFSFINSAAQILTPKVSGGAGPAIPADGLIYQLYSDGTDITYRGTQNPVFHVREEQASGTSAGASSAGSNTRVLNTVVTNTISGASLASNQATLPAGKYKVTATATTYRSGANRITLYNVTDASIAVVGSNAHTANSDATMSISHITEGKIDISASKTFEVRHYITTAVATNGLGVAVTSGDVEVYTEIVFEKIG